MVAKDHDIPPPDLDDIETAPESPPESIEEDMDQELDGLDLPDMDLPDPDGSKDEPGSPAMLQPLETPARKAVQVEEQPEDEDDEDDEYEEEEQEPEKEVSTPIQSTMADGKVFEGRIVQEIDLTTMPLELGHRVHIRPGGLKERVEALFVGMELNSYLVVRLAGLHAELAEVFPFLYPDNEVKLFFTDKGVLNGFLCHVIAYKASPFRHLYLSYPHKGEFFTLRQQDRYLCHLPASMDLGPERLHGMVQDLSLGGCSLNLAHPDPESLPVHKDMEVDLNFSLLSATHENRARGLVRNLRVEADILGLGLSFTGMDKGVEDRIVHFLDFLSRYRGTRENSMR